MIWGFVFKKAITRNPAIIALPITNSQKYRHVWGHYHTSRLPILPTLDLKYFDCSYGCMCKITINKCNWPEQLHEFVTFHHSKLFEDSFNENSSSRQDLTCPSSVSSARNERKTNAPNKCHSGNRLHKGNEETVGTDSAIDGSEREDSCSQIISAERNLRRRLDNP